MRKIILVLISFLFICSSTGDFKSEQKNNKRVRQAYKDKESEVLKTLRDNNLELNMINIYLRVFKQEKLVELWAKNKNSKTFKLICEFDICALSGNPGPKRQQGDLQIPEGYYHINRFNPWSQFYLSLGINYPNKSDKILTDARDPGGDIYIHGSCVTIGCIPITNDRIKELYIYCVEAKNNGQQIIPVTFFPAKMTETNYGQLKKINKVNNETLGLWEDLKDGYDFFQANKRLPTINFLKNGRHQIN